MNEIIEKTVRSSLEEDIGNGDISANLIPEDKQSTAQIITRETAIIAGQPWVKEVYRQLDPSVTIYWLVNEGASALPNQPIANLTGKARSLLTGERTALNWLQTLCATATITAKYVNQLQGTNTQLLDTRKTLPGLRFAQKYATRCGGAQNHRMGLYDAFLIKENHIQSCGSIQAAVKQARNNHPELPIEVGVESLDELKQALSAKANRVMLDNFSVDEIKEAVKITQGKAELEVSGNITLENIKSIANTGVDFISSGALTKHIQAIDLSMKIL